MRSGRRAAASRRAAALTAAASGAGVARARGASRAAALRFAATSTGVDRKFEGKVSTTGPGRPASAMRQAVSKYSTRRSAEGAVPAHLVIGVSSCWWSTTNSAPGSVQASGKRVTSTTTGEPN
jgi:hypothetical protein